QTYVVKYNSNGGTGTMNSSTFKQGESKKLLKNTFTKDGYTFKGWSISSNSKDVIYTDEQEVSNLTNVYNGIVNLYAVWVKENITYQVKYNANGGTTELNFASETIGNYAWSYSDGEWTAKNSRYSGSSILKSEEFTINKKTTITFEWGSIVGDGVGDEFSSSIGINYYKDGGEKTEIKQIANQTGNFTYKSDSIELGAGTYVLEFILYCISPGAGYEDVDEDSLPSNTGYVKNVMIAGNGTSTHTTGIKSKLTKNAFTKIGNIFKGWSTSATGEVKYKDEEEIIDLAEENNAIVELYAVWEKEKYDVNVVVQNGIINGASSKKIKYNENGIFNITPNIGNSIGIVTCTNNKAGIYRDMKLIIKNVSNDTTCTVKLVEETTTLHEDGTLIINEQGINASSNTTKHGGILNEYEPMSASNSYVFSSMSDQPWRNNANSIKSVEIGKTIKPTSTAYWFCLLSYMEKGNFTNLDVSKTLNMTEMFYNVGYHPTTFSLTGLDKWDTGNATTMSNMFYNVGYNAAILSLDLSGWNTSSVTNMSYMFYNVGYNATTFSLTGLDKWDTGNATTMSNMFYNVGYNAAILSLDLSGWNTSSVTNMSYMFYKVGYNATTLTLDLSGWNTSSVRNMKSMFNSAGNSATSIAIKIPRWSGAGAANTTSKLYGASAQTYAVGRFTLS
ncbi:MAG: BspA family leucine-rich repeat surface protein, partial [bacterium]|nr:BspA family leucine-rich repeat surface protein [bacterium]